VISQRAIVLLMMLVAACGGQEQPIARVPDGSAGSMDGDADTRDGSATDAGTVQCGNTICEPSEICLYPAYGCLVWALPDSGTCPDGTTYSAPRNVCLGPVPTPSCIVPQAGTGSIDCSEDGTLPRCDIVNAPIPASCSRTCRQICI
jgi:hypothetical protein